MQQVKGHMFSSLVVISLTLAALSAPPSVFAETTSPPVPSAPADTTAPAPQLPPVPDPIAASIRIGLGWGLSAAEVSAPGGIYVIGDGAMQAQLPPGEAVMLTMDAGKIAVGSLTGKFATVRLVPVAPAQAAPATPGTPVLPAPNSVAAVPAKPANPIAFKGKTYRGEIQAVIPAGSSTLSVVNVVNLDEYLLGVVPEEVPYEWPLETLKAQAVAARTYAEANRGKQSRNGFDLVYTTDDQFYGGLASERLQTSQAVVATRGQFLTYGGKPISAMYHSSSGGHTENNEVIYASTRVEYLRGVKDFDDLPGNINYAWQKSYSMADLTTRLKNRGFDVGIVTNLSPSGTIGVSGRPSHWLLTGTAGTQTLTGSQVRTALNVLSNPRVISVQPGGFVPTVKTYTGGQTVALMSTGGAVHERTITGAAVVAAGGTPVGAAGSVTAMGAKMNQPSGIIVSGGGNGHAVGMSQWGAYGMGLLGKNYVEILTHYYRGTKLETRQMQ